MGVFNSLRAGKPLNSLLFRAFSLDNFSTSIAPTRRANVVGQLGTVALGASVQKGRLQAEVAASLALTCLGNLSLW